MIQSADDFVGYVEALNAASESGDAAAAAAALGNLGRAASAAGLAKRAVLYYDVALTLHRAVGDAWGSFLDLLNQGEELLGMPGQLVPALACYSMAHESAVTLEAPEADRVEARLETVIRQISAKLPEQGQQLRKALEDDAETLRAQGVQLLLEEGALAAAYFDDQLLAARLLGDAAGIFLSLGSQTKVLIDGGELAGAVAALLLAEAASTAVQGLSKEERSSMIADWRRGTEEAASSRGTTVDALRGDVREGLEAARAAATARLISTVAPGRGGHE